MTRAYLTSFLSRTLGEYGGSLAALNPFDLDQYITTAADLIAQNTYCYYGYYYADVVAGQPEYCASEIFDMQSIAIKDSTGCESLLMAMTPNQMDAQYGASWRDPQQWSTGLPLVYVQEGVNRFRLYPVPDYSFTAGVRTEGYMTPLWPDPDDECPFPVRSHIGVMYGACILRVVALPTQENINRLKGLQMMYQSVIDPLERQAAIITGANRYAHYNGSVGQLGQGYYWGGGSAVSA